MTKEQEIIWFAGLFEGEGTFAFVKGKARSIAVTSTDRDVLERIRQSFGGSIYPITKRKEHWKDAWRWCARTKLAEEISLLIKPYLLSRRSQRCEEWLQSRMETQDVKDKSVELKHKILELRKLGLTHINIATKLGYDRTHITKILNGA